MKKSVTTTVFVNIPKILLFTIYFVLVLATEFYGLSNNASKVINGRDYCLTIFRILLQLAFWLHGLADAPNLIKKPAPQRLFFNMVLVIFRRALYIFSSTKALRRGSYI